jgi:hypothetical protein
VTDPLVGVYVAFHPDVITCPEGSVNASVQPLIVEEPVFVMVMLAVSPVFQALTRYATWHPPDGGGLCEALGEIDGRGDGLTDGDTDAEGLG